MNNEINYVSPFTRFCISIGNLPTAYLESMSYYESLTYLVNYLANNVIPALNNNGEVVEEVQQKFTELKNYVDTYFDNLDVQQEINNKLDEMAEDGTLTTLIGNYVQPLINEQNEEIAAFKNEVNNDIDVLETEIRSVASGSPLVASSTSEMTDTTRVYVNTTDGYWYYFNGSNWVSGGVYQATALSSNEQAIFDKLQEDNGYFTGELKPLLEMGNIGILETGWTYSDSTTRVRTKENTVVHLYPGDTIELLDEDYVMYLGYRDMDGNYYYTAWTNAKQTVTFEGEYVILIRTNPEGSITVEEVKNILKITSINQLNYLQNNLKTNSNNRVNVDYFRKMFTNAGLALATNRGFAQTNIRLSLTSGIKLDYDLIIEVPNGYEIGIELWNGTVAGSNFVRDTGWLSNIVKLPKDELLTIEIRKTDNSEIPLNFRDNINFYRPEESHNQYDLIKSPINSINHRGYNSLAPEETAPAYKLSKEHGFDIVECDIRLTSDGHVVLCHDATIDRTSNGTGYVADKTLAELKALDFGSWFSPEYAGTEILTLEEFLSLCRNINLSCYIEIEPDAGFTFDKLQEVAQIVENYHMTDKVTYISFGLTMLNMMSVISPKSRLGVNVNSSTIADRTITQILMLRGDYNYVFINSLYTAINSTLITFCKNNKLSLECWTPYTETEINNMDPFVNGFTTDILVAEDVLYNSNID